jgi:hypothetical protein
MVNNPQRRTKGAERQIQEMEHLFQVRFAINLNKVEQYQ